MATDHFDKMRLLGQEQAIRELDQRVKVLETAIDLLVALPTVAPHVAKLKRSLMALTQSVAVDAITGRN